jgi:predicted HicB family RNase H-like nuclease
MKNKQKFLAIRLDAELHHKLKMQALQERISIQLLIERLIERNLSTN